MAGPSSQAKPVFSLFSELIVSLKYVNYVRNSPNYVNFSKILCFTLYGFFIGYWIKKTELDFYPASHFFRTPQLNCIAMTPHLFGCSRGQVQPAGFDNQK